MDAKAQLLNALRPVFDHVKTLALDAPEGAATDLSTRFAPGSETLQAIADAFAAGFASGELCQRENEGIYFSRLLKPTAEEPWGIDLVRMDKAGPGHTHPNGEVDLCFSVDGSPTFDGQGPGFTVYPPGSWHVPTVSGGTMNIIYFLPEGAITFGPRPATA